MRVRATGSPRAHPLEVVGHGRRSPRIPKPVDGLPTWQVARCQACNTQSDEAQATAIQHERSSLRCRRAVLLELDSCSVVSGDENFVFVAPCRANLASQCGVQDSPGVQLMRTHFLCTMRSSATIGLFYLGLGARWLTTTAGGGHRKRKTIERGVGGFLRGAPLNIYPDRRGEGGGESCTDCSVL